MGLTWCHLVSIWWYLWRKSGLAFVWQEPVIRVTICEPDVGLLVGWSKRSDKRHSLEKLPRDTRDWLQRKYSYSRSKVTSLCSEYIDLSVAVKHDLSAHLSLKSLLRWERARRTPLDGSWADGFLFCWSCDGWLVDRSPSSIVCRWCSASVNQARTWKWLSCSCVATLMAT